MKLNKTGLIAILGVSFGYIEAAVVVYLRKIFYPGGFSFPIRIMSPDILRIETGREIAAIVLLASTAAAAGRRPSEKISCFLLAFAVWDITYYVWLKALINWPSGIFDWDVLFLIPAPWTSPVLAPVIVSFLMIVWFMVLLRAGEKIGKVKISPTAAVLLIVSAATLITAFLWNVPVIAAGVAPGSFPWLLFGAGILISFAAMKNFIKENMGLPRPPACGGADSQ